MTVEELIMHLEGLPKDAEAHVYAYEYERPEKVFVVSRIHIDARGNVVIG